MIVRIPTVFIKEMFAWLLMLSGILFLSCNKDDAPESTRTHLQNDGYTEQGSRTFIEKAIPGEEIAVTLGPVTKPFQVTFLEFLFGGTGQVQSSREVMLKIYEDLGNPSPGIVIFQGVFSIPSSNSLLYQLDLRDQHIIALEGGAIRVSFEFIDDIGFPSFAEEFDGLYDPSHNWIKPVSGIWMSNNTSGQNGNWVIRAVVDTNF